MLAYIVKQLIIGVAAMHSARLVFTSLLQNRIVSPNRCCIAFSQFLAFILLSLH